MNIKSLTILTLFATSAIALPVYGIDSYTLPSGKVLEDPTIVSRNPIGIEVAHSTGVIFVKYSELPKDMQKKLGYSPEKASEYVKDAAKKRQVREEKNKAKAKVEASERSKRELVILERAQVRLEDKIAATKLRVKFLIVEIPKLEAKKASRMDSSTGLASRSSNSNDGGYSSYYGGTSTRNRSDRSERTKRRTINALDSEYEEAKDDLIFSQKELKNKQFEIRKMERLYKKHEVELAAKRAAVNGKNGSSKESKESKSFMSGVTNLFK